MITLVNICKCFNLIIEIVLKNHSFCNESKTAMLLLLNVIAATKHKYGVKTHDERLYS